MLQISEIVRKTEEMFDLFNEHFCEGELSLPAITVSPDGGARSLWLGAVSTRYGTPAARSIRKSISVPSTLTDPSSSCATLLHKMAHLYNLVHCIQDVSNNGYYHNHITRNSRPMPRPTACISRSTPSMARR